MSLESPERLVRIATRESALALWQARYVADLLRTVDPHCTIELIHVSTQGDRDRTEPLAQLGGIGVFTREVQRAVLDNRAEIAVHSLKDLPTQSVDGLTLAGIPARAARFDALLLPNGTPGTIETLTEGARIGTGSLRRQAQLLYHRPDLEMRNIRGNVETRIQKLQAGEYDAIILAEAGLRRLDMGHTISVVLEPPLMFPAVGQAALGIECRTEDDTVRSLLARITDVATRAEVTAERACLAALRAGCHAPVGVHSKIVGSELTLEAVVLSPDGAQRFQTTTFGDVHTATDIGSQAAERLIQNGAADVLAID